MQKDDKTPIDWILPVESFCERVIKKPIRLLIYPIYLNLRSRILKKKYFEIVSDSLKIDLFIYGTRGLEYQLLRSLLNKHSPLKNKSIMIAGCGTGRDIPSWINYSPKNLICVDYYCYKKSWEIIKNYYSNKKTKISFIQQNLESMNDITSNSLDIIGSDAVFEHLRNFPSVVSEFYRVLKPGGVLYANFGPLWRTWSGDHLSGFDALRSGFNHLLLNEKEYHKYLDSYGKFSHNEHDGRTWINSQMFSYLVAEEYIERLEQQGFKKLHISCSINPETEHFFKKFPTQSNYLINIYKKSDLLVAGLTIIYEKPNYNIS